MCTFALPQDFLPQWRYKAWQKTGCLRRAATPKALARTSCSARWEGERSCHRLSTRPSTRSWCMHLMLRGATQEPCHYLQTNLFCRGKNNPAHAALPYSPGQALQLPAALGSAGQGRAAGRGTGCWSRAALVPAGRSQLGRVISSPGNFSVSYLGYLEGKG